jgi:hypothetical protein
MEAALMSESDPESDPSTPEPSEESTDEGRDIRDLLLRGVLVVLGLVAVVALFQFYTSALAVINEWIAREYRALFRATFNLVILVASIIGISLVVRELTRSSD